jgi:predicted nucleic acid-binding protein
MPTIILDTDWLSSFLKIGRCDLIRSLYQVEQVIIPTAVHRELAQTDLLALLPAVPWIRTLSPDLPFDEDLGQDSVFLSLGAGEQACIVLAQTLPDALLLMSDNKARRFASSLGISVANIPAFLLACKTAGLVDSEEMTQIIEDLKDKDFYTFRSDARDLLLK